MRITAAGNVGIGVTDPAATLSVVGKTNLGNQASGFYVTPSTLHVASPTVSQISFEDYIVTAAIALANNTFAFGHQGSSPSYEFRHSNTFNGNYASTGTIFARFNPTTSYISSGNVGIGTTDPSQKLTVRLAGAVTNTQEILASFFYQSTGTPAIGLGPTIAFYTPSSGDASQTQTRVEIGGVAESVSGGAEQTGIVFKTPSSSGSGTVTERMRITSGGNVLIANAGQTDGALIVGRNGNNNSILAVSDANNTSEAYFRGYSTAVSSSGIVIFSNGNIVNTNNSYGALSDIKIKENIKDATPKLEDLLKVKIRKYNLIGEETKQIGVIAQELEEVFPAMIDESHDKDKDGNDLGTTTKSVKYSVFVPMLIKAIQEQQAQIETLKSKIEILEQS
jgi:hypothetical protein